MNTCLDVRKLLLWEVNRPHYSINQTSKFVFIKMYYSIDLFTFEDDSDMFIPKKKIDAVDRVYGRPLNRNTEILK